MILDKALFYHLFTRYIREVLSGIINSNIGCKCNIIRLIYWLTQMTFDWRA